MLIKIGDKVTAYHKHWIVNNVRNADEVEKELPDIGRALKRLNMTLLVLESAPKTMDLMIMRIYGQPEFTTVLVDNKTGNFHDPDTVLPPTLKSLVQPR
jgi:hypothetical protein